MMLLLPASQAQTRHGSGSNQMHMLWPPLLSTGMDTGLLAAFGCSAGPQDLSVTLSGEVLI